jgi:hypothetical protein
MLWIGTTELSAIRKDFAMRKLGKTLKEATTGREGGRSKKRGG